MATADNVQGLDGDWVFMEKIIVMVNHVKDYSNSRGILLYSSVMYCNRYIMHKKSLSDIDIGLSNLDPRGFR